MKNVLTLLAAAGGALLLLKLLVQYMEPRLTFHPEPGESQTPADFGVPFQQRQLVTSDGERIMVWSLPHPEPEAEMLFFHGNAGNLSLWLDFLLDLHGRGYAVTALDYRGYGKSSGTPSEEGLFLDTRALMDWFWSQPHREPLPVVYFGRSLGGVVAAHAASRVEPDGLILEGTFPDKSTLLKHYPVLLLLSWFSRYRLDTIHHLRDVICPILVIHGDADRVVPIEAGRRLWETLPVPGEFYRVSGAGHNDAAQVGGEAYWERIGQFIERLKHGSNPP